MVRAEIWQGVFGRQVENGAIRFLKRKLNKTGYLPSEHALMTWMPGS